LNESGIHNGGTANSPVKNQVLNSKEGMFRYNRLSLGNYMAPNYFTLMQNQASHEAQSKEEIKRNNQDDPDVEFVATYEDINLDEEEVLESP
jgi:hypothetical protein